MNSGFIDSRNNKKISSILFISTDINYVEKVKKILNNRCNIVFFDSDRFYLLNENIANFDLIIFDNNENLLPNFI